MKIKHQYSNNSSRDFWKRVNSLKNKADWQELYSLGVILQDLESKVLRRLSDVEKESKLNKKSKK